MWKPTPKPTPERRDRSPLEQFEQMYRREVDSVVGHLARKCRDPQTLADLTAETFGQAASGFTAFMSRRGSDRAWLLGLADQAFEHRHERPTAEPDSSRHAERPRQLGSEELEELTRRIDLEHAEFVASAPPPARGPAPARHGPEDDNMNEMRRSWRLR